MRHQSALSYNGKKNDEATKEDRFPQCDAPLEESGRGFWDDIGWVIYTCTGCHQQIATVGGRSHWWNYILKPEKEDKV